MSRFLKGLVYSSRAWCSVLGRNRSKHETGLGSVVRSVVPVRSRLPCEGLVHHSSFLGWRRRTLEFVVRSLSNSRLDLTYFFANHTWQKVMSHREDVGSDSLAVNQRPTQADFLVPRVEGLSECWSFVGCWSAVKGFAIATIKTFRSGRLSLSTRVGLPSSRQDIHQGSSPVVLLHGGDLLE